VTDARGRAPRSAGRPHRPRDGSAKTTPLLSDAAIQRAARDAVDEVTAVDDRLRVRQVVATLGWGGVLFVDVYTASNTEILEDLDPALRKRIALAVDRPYERVTIRWRINE
jgi:hypothetical protein